MSNELTQLGASRALPARQVFLLAGVALLVGLVLGYRIPGSQPSGSSPPAPAQAAQTPLRTGVASSPHPPTLDEMKQMAEGQAAPLLDKLKSDPTNTDLLAQVGAVYYVGHEFQQAVIYYNRAVQSNPANVPLRNKLAIGLYRTGDADGAIAQLKQALQHDPKDANSLFNLGLIRLQAKGDGKGALAAWQKLLTSNPQLSAERKAMVQKLMTQVLMSMGDSTSAKGAPGHASEQTRSE